MPDEHTALAIAQGLISIDTSNPPGKEGAAADYLAPLLGEAGFSLKRVEASPGRSNLIALCAGEGPRPPLCLTGHLDTVPLGAAPWQRDPFSPQIADGRLYGRGASDMKGGVAAMVAAALRLARLPRGKGGLLLVLTADEEQGCQGALFLAQQGSLGRAGGLLVGEPTGNRLCLGHKGALWLKASCRGKAAHGSMPHEGDNAIYKAARAVCQAAEYSFNAPPHPQLDGPTLNVGRIEGGSAVNMVPDRAWFTLDLRTLPGMDHGRLRQDLAGALGPQVELVTTVDVPGFWTEADDPFAAMVSEVLGELSGEVPPPAGASYFTDGPALAGALGGPPLLLLGPGEPDQAHQTDEWCQVDNLAWAEEAYFQIARRWCGL